MITPAPERGDRSSDPGALSEGPLRTVVLAGNPNAGKTSLFNALTGLRATTANFPGTTVEHRLGGMRLAGRDIDLVDLPGMYSLRSGTPEEQVAADVLLGRGKDTCPPGAVVVIVDADNLERNLFLVSQILEHDLRVIVALNMIDIADRHGIHVDAEALAADLGCPVIPIVARTGQGVDGIRSELERIARDDTGETFALDRPKPACDACGSCPFQSRYAWTEQIAARCVRSPRVAKGRRTEKIDKVLTHPVVGMVAFFAVMLVVFYLIFSVASVPMDLIDALFAHAGSFVTGIVPDGWVQSLLVDGVIGGVGGILVFLPQICILFFFLALLEDSGYLARAAFVMDRLMRRIGLPGTSFVPLLSAHACAIPAIMATRVIKDPRDRLVTILVAPLITCSARIPVYALVTALLFPNDPVMAAMLFVGAYGLGVAAALAMSFLFRCTILPGEAKPLVLELPGYRVPGLRTALLLTFDRAKVFVQQAGTIILLISVILWGLAYFPVSDPPPEAVALTAQAEELAAAGRVDEAEAAAGEADRLAARGALAHSFAGRLGHLIEPLVAPLGFDWQIGIGVISSFAAREVIVSTLSVVYGVGDDAEGEEAGGLYSTLRRATRQDGSPVFTTATCVSLLVFYVLAMQCLPTQAVTRRETGTWKWAILQLVYMTLLAYGAALIAFQVLSAMGMG